MGTDVMASKTPSGKQEYPDMFEFSEAQFSKSAFDSDIFDLPGADAEDDNNTNNGGASTENKTEDDPAASLLNNPPGTGGGAAAAIAAAAPSALGDRDDTEVSSEELLLDAPWIPFKVDEKPSGGEYFAGLENAKLVLKVEKEENKTADDNNHEGGEEKGDKTTTSKVPKLKRCQTDTASGAARGQHHNHHPKGTHRGRKAGGGGAGETDGHHHHHHSKNGSRGDRRSVSPKRSGSKRSVSPMKRGSSPLRRTNTTSTTTSGGEDVEKGPKRSPLRRATSGGGGGDGEKGPKRSPLRRTTSTGHQDLTPVAKPSLRRATSAGGGHHPELTTSRIKDSHYSHNNKKKQAGPSSSRSLSPKQLHRDRSERSHSPRRIVSSRKLKSSTSDPEITSDLLDDDDDDDDDPDKDDDAVNELKLLPTTSSSAKQRRVGSGKSVLSDSSDENHHHKKNNHKRSSSPNLVTNKPRHISSRVKSTGERGRHPGSNRSKSPISENKRASSPCLHGKSPRSSPVRNKSTSTKRDSSGMTSPPPPEADDNEDDDDDNNKEIVETKSDETPEVDIDEEGAEDKTTNPKTRKSLHGLLEDNDDDDEVIPDIDEATYVSEAVGRVEKKSKAVDASEKSDGGGGSSGDELDDSSKKRNKRSTRDKTTPPSRGVGRSRSLPRNASSSRELSKSPSSRFGMGRSEKTHCTRRDKSPARDICNKRVPASMREVMSMELTKSAGISATSNNNNEEADDDGGGGGGDDGNVGGATGAPTPRHSRSPTRDLKRGALSSRDVGRSPTRGLTRSDASTREIVRPNMAKARSLMNVSSVHDKKDPPKRPGNDEDNNTDNKDSSSNNNGATPHPGRRTLQRAISEKAPHSRRGLGRAQSSRSPVRDQSRRRMKEETPDDDNNNNNNNNSSSSGSDRLGPSTHHGRLARDASSRTKDSNSDSIPRNSSRGQLLESKRSRRRMKDEADTEDKPEQDAPTAEKNTPKPNRGPPIRRTLSGPRGGGGGARGRHKGNIQQRQLMGGLGATDHQRDGSERDELQDSSSAHNNPAASFQGEEIGDLFAKTSLHERTTQRAADPSLSPPKSPIKSVKSAISGKAKSIFGKSHHGGSPDGQKDKNKRTFRTSIFGGKGGKTIQGPSMLDLGGNSDDLESSSEEFA